MSQGEIEYEIKTNIGMSLENRRTFDALIEEYYAEEKKRMEERKSDKDA